VDGRDCAVREVQTEDVDYAGGVVFDGEGLGVRCVLEDDVLGVVSYSLFPSV
jgi:hypothetical protein